MIHSLWSVIVPTYQREKVLCDTITHLLDLSYPHYELIVVDQTPLHEPETEQFLQQIALRIRYIRIQQVGMCHARNVGLEAARGDYLLYVDDDIIPPKDLIELHMRNLIKPRIGAATGGIYIEQKKLPPQPKACMLLPYGRLYQYWAHEITSGLTDSLAGGNMSMARQLAIDVGLFDEGYIGRANWEETDFSLRIQRHGYQLAYDPAAAVVHLGHPTGGSRASQDVDDGRYFYESHYNNAYFFAKNLQQRYLPWLLKRELGWILIKQGILQRHPERTIPSLQGLWHGYWAGLRKRSEFKEKPLLKQGQDEHRNG